MYRLEIESCRLHSDGTLHQPVSSEENMVGFCTSCDGELWSVAYYETSDLWLVAARCRGCQSFVLIRYDKSWRWLGDFELEAGPKLAGISSIPKEKLEAVFSASELRAMEAFERGEPYTRQNLYRARAKYAKFEKLFGTRIDL